VTYSQPAPAGARRTDGGRRRRALLGAVLASFLALAAFAAARHPRGDNGRVSPVGWPQRGQAAVVLGNGRATARPHEQPAPIASLAKVMTAYLILKRYPLSGAQDGFTITATSAQAQAEAEDAAQDQSVVAVGAGEQLTERQLLEALLIPSGNNIAPMLASRVAGSETRFVAEMNAQARALGMDRTTYTDPSGFDPSTVSTAADQLRVFQRAMGFSAFRQIVSMASVTLPVAGTLTNYNPLIAAGYAGKTGSDSAAGGCLAFFTHVTVGGRRLTAVGVVLGQGQGGDTSEILAAAGEAAEQLVKYLAPTTPVPRIAASGAAGGGGRDAAIALAEPLGEALPPARIARLPAELALGLGVRRTLHLGHRERCRLTGGQPAEPAWDPPGWLGIQRAGQHRQPLPHRCGVVVDHVVDTRLAVLDRDRGRRGGVVDVDLREDATPVADDREPALADRCRHHRVLSLADRGARTVESAVAQHQTLPPLDTRHRPLQI
jgi:D-alanyl-D-alanine carboxypeptidase (penicillin-binding protein 5/6)